MGLSYRLFIVSWIVWIALPLPAAVAQGRLEDYQRAQRFLPGNLRDVAFISDMTPNWIEKTNRFWYRRGGKGSEFILVDADQNTIGPAFNHARLAQGLSHAAGREYRPAELPFMFFDFIQGGKAIRFQVQSATWICELADYHCQEDPAAAREGRSEATSPDKHWAAYVKEHNLFLRNIATGEAVQLTNDGVPEWDYATPLPSLRLMVNQGKEEVTQPPAVFWAPDSSRLVSYRLDSRNAGRFTSLQFVPSDQLRPKAFTYAYPLPGELLAKAAPVIFEVPSGKRIEVKTAPLDIHFQGGPGFTWFQDSRHFRYNEVERGHKAMELRMVDARTGEQKTVLREQAERYVDPGQTFFRFLDSGNEVLYSSEFLRA